MGVDPFSSRELNAFGLVEAAIGGAGRAEACRPCFPAGPVLLSRKAAEPPGHRAPATPWPSDPDPVPATLRMLGYLEPRNNLAASLVDDILLADLSTAQEALDAPAA